MFTSLTCLRLFMFDLKTCLILIRHFEKTSNSSSPSWFCLIFSSFRRLAPLRERSAPTPASLPLRQSWAHQINGQSTLEEAQIAARTWGQRDDTPVIWIWFIVVCILCTYIMYTFILVKQIEQAWQRWYMAHAISIHILLIYGSIQGKAVRAGFPHRNKQVSPLGLHPKHSLTFLPCLSSHYPAWKPHKSQTIWKSQQHQSQFATHLVLGSMTVSQRPICFLQTDQKGPFIGSDRITSVKFSNFTTPQGGRPPFLAKTKGNQHTVRKEIWAQNLQVEGVFCILFVWPSNNSTANV